MAKFEGHAPDEHVGRVYSGLPLPGLVATSGLPQYQEILCVVLAGGTTSLSDSLPASPLGAAGAENTRSGRTGEHASLLSIAGDGGVGKTTALLMLCPR
jgi:hypothetical protein